MKQATTPWMTGPKAWDEFVLRHPELGYKPGRMNFHNFLRQSRGYLLQADAIRFAKNRFWIAHVERFCLCAFEYATGKREFAEIHLCSAS